MRALLARLPGLAAIPRVDLGVRETPLERWRVASATLRIKRDDLSAPTLGGNKVRALELLLAGVPAGHRLLTVGATGSTHALAVARHGARLGLETDVITWPQEEHPVARETARAMSRAARVTRASSPVDAYLRALGRRLRGDVHWVAAGGSVPLGALGHVSAALELAEQLRHQSTRRALTLVAPLGSGGTVAGLLVGLQLAGVRGAVIGVQVVPRLVASHARIARLARRTRALIARHAGEPLPDCPAPTLQIERGAYGGAYGRPTAAALAATAKLRDAGGPPLEPTYSGKAFAVALDRALRSPDEQVVFWLTFDGRWLSGTEA